MIKNILFGLLPTIMCMVIVEFISSFFSPKSSVFWDNPMMLQYPVERFDQNITREKMHFSVDPNRSVRYVPDLSRWYRLDPEPTIPPSEKLIFHFGDSSSWGWGLTNRGDAYAGVLSNFLPPLVHSINLGVPGYSSLQGLKYLELMLPLYHERLLAVTVYFGNNDATENGMSDYQRLDMAIQRNMLTNFYFWLEQRSAFYRIMRGFISKVNPGNNRIPRVSPDENRANIQSMINLCKKYGVRIILIEPPVHFSWKPGHLTHTRPLKNDVKNQWVLNELNRAQQLYKQGVAYIHNHNDGYESSLRNAVEHDWVMSRIKRRWCEVLRSFAGQVDIIRLPIAFIEAEFPYYFTDYCHPSVRVHKLIARAIARKLNLHKT
ncbi:MAG: GDSL-type esterase/lipase family protein [Patescibacteria group bacterium]